MRKRDNGIFVVKIQATANKFKVLETDYSLSPKAMLLYMNWGATDSPVIKLTRHLTCYTILLFWKLPKYQREDAQSFKSVVKLTS